MNGVIYTKLNIDQIDSNQYKHLADKEKWKEKEFSFGTIKGKSDVTEARYAKCLLAFHIPF